MKERHVILGLAIVFLMLMVRFFMEPKTKNELDVDPSTLTSKELEVFAILENQIQSNNDGKSSQKAGYQNRYPKLYAGQADEWKYSADIPEDLKICYLTFDDGPSENTLTVLDILDEYQIKAAFFIIGEEILLTENNKEILQEVVNRGHLIGLHTYCHDYPVIYASVDAFLKDYEQVFSLIQETTGQSPFIYRFPGGSYNGKAKWIRNDIISEMERRGFVYYDWNVSGEDSVGHPTSSSILRNVKKDLLRYQLPVVLLHDGQTSQVTAKTLKQVIEWVKSQGYSFGRLDERFPCQFKW